MPPPLVAVAGVALKLRIFASTAGLTWSVVVALVTPCTLVAFNTKVYLTGDVEVFAGMFNGTEIVPPLQLGAAGTPTSAGLTEREHEVAPTTVAERSAFPPTGERFVGDAAKALTVGGLVGSTTGVTCGVAPEALSAAEVAAPAITGATSITEAAKTVKNNFFA